MMKPRKNLHGMGQTCECRPARLTVPRLGKKSLFGARDYDGCERARLTFILLR